MGGKTIPAPAPHAIAGSNLTPLAIALTALRDALLPVEVEFVSMYLMNSTELRVGVVRKTQGGTAMAPVTMMSEFEILSTSTENLKNKFLLLL